MMRDRYRVLEIMPDSQPWDSMGRFIAPDGEKPRQVWRCWWD